MTAYRIVVRGPAWRAAYEGPLADPNRLLAQPGARIVKHNARSTVGFVCVDGDDLAVKIFDESRPDRFLRRWLGGSAARRVARTIAALQDTGFAAPPLVAALESPRHPGRSIVITRRVRGPAADGLVYRLRGRRRWAFAAQLADYVRALHDAGFYPQDIRDRNFIIAEAEGRWRFVLVDLDRVKRCRAVSWRRRRKNLVQLNRSFGRFARASEKLWFVHRYLGPIPSFDLQRYVAEIRAASARKEAEYARRRQRTPPPRARSASRQG